MKPRKLFKLIAALCALPLTAQNGFLSPTKVVQIAQGLILGVSDGSVDLFLGIPYAAPPVGDLRWKAPAAAANWPGVRDAIRQGSQCFQPGGDGSEDCLYLNIYRPANPPPSPLLPVILFIHGGGNQQGSGNDYDPSAWVAKTGIMVVTINYRLNVFGFLALPALDAEIGEPSSGNYGLMDQQAAMRWVSANIAAFGGDPQNVTLQGESAGGIDICGNLISPPAAGLFSKAIMESMYCPYATHDDELQTSAPVATALGCTDIPTASACMRTKPAADVLTAAGKLSMAVGDPGFTPSPNIGSSILPLQASDALISGQWNQSTVLIGSNHDEASSFLGGLNGRVKFPLTVQEYQMLVGGQFGSFAPSVLAEYPLTNFSDPFLAFADEETDDSILGCPVSPLSQMFASAAPTFRYEFNDPNAPVQGGSPTDRTLGAYHGSELLFLFTFSQVSKTPAQQALSDQMMRYWANFAKTGDPNGPALAVWPQYHAATHQLLSLKPDAVTVIDNFDAEHHCAFWAAAPGPPFK